MINEQTAIKALNLAKVATTQQIYLQADEDTPLSALCNSTLLFDSNVVDQEKSTIFSDEVNEQALTGFISGANNTPHNAELSTLVEQVKSAVENHLSFSRNVVLSNVNQYIERLEKEKKDFAINPVSLFNIKQVDLPELLFNPAIISELNKAAGVSYLEPRGNAKFDQKTVEELMELIQFGSKSVDDDITKWLVSCSDSANLLAQVWDHYFVSTLEQTTQTLFDSSVINAIEDSENGTDVAIAIFLLARAVREKLPENSKMGQAELKELANEFMDTTANRLLKVIDNKVRQNTAGVVVRKFNTFTNTVFVNKATYLLWLKQGGKVETLLGVLVKNLGATTIDQLNAVATEAQDAWNRFVAISSTKTNNAQMNQFLNSLETHFFLMLKDVGELEKEMFEDPQHVQSIATRFSQELQSVVLSDMDNLDEVCYRLMCQARYFYTPSFKILRDMNTTIKNNPEMDVKEAALVAMINYVTDYVCDQITVRHS